MEVEVGSAAYLRHGQQRPQDCVIAFNAVGYNCEGLGLVHEATRAAKAARAPKAAKAAKAQEGVNVPQMN